MTKINKYFISCLLNIIFVKIMNYRSEIALFLFLIINSLSCIPTTFRPFNTTISEKNISGGILYTPPPKAGNYFSI